MTSYPKVRDAIGASEKSFEYLDRKPDLPPDGHLNPQHLEGCIEFKNVTFSYSGKSDKNDLVLKVQAASSFSWRFSVIFAAREMLISSRHPDFQDVSFKLNPGTITALVGSNSSGKSTCVKLLERFYQPQAGEILLDGQPLLHYRDQYLHEKVSGHGTLHTVGVCNFKASKGLFVFCKYTLLIVIYHHHGQTSGY